MRRKIISLFLTMWGILLVTSTASAYPYKVRAGDCVSVLAQRLHVSRERISAANNLKDEDLILVNQVLEIPMIIIKAEKQKMIMVLGVVESEKNFNILAQKFNLANAQGLFSEAESLPRGVHEASDIELVQAEIKAMTVVEEKARGEILQEFDLVSVSLEKKLQTSKEELVAMILTGKSFQEKLAIMLFVQFVAIVLLSFFLLYFYIGVKKEKSKDYARFNQAMSAPADTAPAYKSDLEGWDWSDDPNEIRLVKCNENLVDDLLPVVRN